MKQARTTRVVLDRLEGDTAVLVLDDDSVAYLPATLLPDGAKPGDTLLLRVTKQRKGEGQPSRQR